MHLNANSSMNSFHFFSVYRESCIFLLFFVILIFLVKIKSYQKSDDLNEMFTSASSKRTNFSRMLGIIILLLLSYFWYKIGSLDKAFKKHFVARELSTSHNLNPGGADWAIINGVRWFKITGTDSAGIGYSGWVSELAFHQELPSLSSGSVSDFFSKLGLPSLEERIEGIKNLRKIHQDLKKEVYKK